MGQKFFSGGNSGEGFYNYFDGILPVWERLERFFIIKGGPGVGKSTLMKRIAARAEEEGEETEYFYCSGDPDSLDAIRLIKRGILFADGTAPHCMDPVFPGAVEEILNLGEQIDRKRIVQYREEVERLTKQNKLFYRRAYAYLKAAAALEEERYLEVSACLDQKKLKKHLLEIMGEKEEYEEKQIRKLFLDAITCKGKLCFAGGMAQRGDCVKITGDYAGVVLDAASRMLSGGRQELFCNPLLPLKVNHVYLPEQKKFLTSAAISGGQEISGDEFMEKVCHENAGQCYAEVQKLTEAAMLCLKECKRLHDELEEIYKACVDFARVSERTEELLETVHSL